MPSFRGHKYNVAPVEQRQYGGRTYASKAERVYAQMLDSLAQSGEVKEWIPQPITILGDTKYVPDFFVLWSDGRAEYVDVKGMMKPKDKKVVQLWAKYKKLPLVLVQKQGKPEQAKFKTLLTVNEPSPP
jgi:hypothetical protein